MIWDLGLRIFFFNPKSQIPNPESNMAETDANKPKSGRSKKEPPEPKTVAEAKQLEDQKPYWQLTDDEVLLRSPEPDDTYTTSDSWRVFRIMGEFVGGFDNMATITHGVSVFGSARTREEDEYYKAAVEVGHSAELIVTFKAI